MVGCCCRDHVSFRTHAQDGYGLALQVHGAQQGGEEAEHDAQHQAEGEHERLARLDRVQRSHCRLVDLDQIDRAQIELQGSQLRLFLAEGGDLAQEQLLLLALQQPLDLAIALK